MATLTLTEPVDDTYLNSQFPQFNYGGFGEGFLGKRNDAFQFCRPLLRFDLSALPGNAIISSATLSFVIYDDFSSNARTCRVYRMLKSWVEGTGTGGLPSDGADWNTYDGTTPWGAVGGFGTADCEQTAIGSRDFSASETVPSTVSISLTPTTKGALDNGNGWMLKMDTEDNDAYGFAFKESVSFDAPSLTIEYAVPPVVPGSAQHTIGRVRTGYKVLGVTL